ncbi:MAG: DUF6686 family protein [Bacteroidota bacterium]
MCCTDESVTLSETNDSLISYCKTCKAFSLSFKSTCASFTLQELNEFYEILDHLIDMDFYYEMGDKHYAIIKNPYVSLGFCLTREDVNDLKSVMNEAKAMYEVFHIVYQ